MKVRRYLPLSGVSIPHLILISSLIFSSIPDSQVKTFGPSVRSHPLLCVKCFPGSLSSKAITLRSIQIYNTHEFLGPHPTIYFYCKGENKTILPDVKEKHFSYIFYGEESWQPLTELPGKKCKRCGLYEFDTIKSDDVFDEWDLCLDDFINGISIHYKAKQFNATLLCEDCQVATDSAQTSSSSDGSANKKIDLILVVVISVLVSIMATIVTVGAYKYWQKREKDQAHFLKLFEEGDDIEDELGLSM